MRLKREGGRGGGVFVSGVSSERGSTVYNNVTEQLTPYGPGEGTSNEGQFDEDDCRGEGVD